MGVDRQRVVVGIPHLREVWVVELAYVLDVMKGSLDRIGIMDTDSPQDLFLPPMNVKSCTTGLRLVGSHAGPTAK